jgi:hypothetical protein
VAARRGTVWPRPPGAAPSPWRGRARPCPARFPPPCPTRLPLARACAACSAMARRDPGSPACGRGAPLPASPRSPLPALGARLRARAVWPGWLAGAVAPTSPWRNWRPQPGAPRRCPPARSPSLAWPWRPTVAAQPRPARRGALPACSLGPGAPPPACSPSPAVARPSSPAMVARPRPPSAASPPAPRLALAPPRDVPARCGLELGQRVALRGRPWHGPVVACGAQCSACAAQPRRVRDPFATRQRGRARACSRGAWCFSTARRALGALVYPLDVPVYPPPCIPCVVIALFN